MAWNQVSLTTWSSYNYSFFPGIAIDRESFYGSDTARAINALIHEPQHNLGHGFLGSGLGHSHISPVLGASGSDGDSWSQLIDFLKAAKLRDGRSLWQGMLDEAAKP